MILLRPRVASSYCWNNGLMEARLINSQTKWHPYFHAVAAELMGLRVRVMDRRMLGLWWTGEIKEKEST